MATRERTGNSRGTAAASRQMIAAQLNRTESHASNMRTTHHLSAHPSTCCSPVSVVLIVFLCVCSAMIGGALALLTVDPTVAQCRAIAHLAAAAHLRENDTATHDNTHARHHRHPQHSIAHYVSAACPSVPLPTMSSNSSVHSASPPPHPCCVSHWSSGRRVRRSSASRVVRMPNVVCADIVQ